MKKNETMIPLRSQKTI